MASIRVAQAMNLQSAYYTIGKVVDFIAIIMFHFLNLSIISSNNHLEITNIHV